MYDIQWFKVEKNIFYNRKIQLLLGYKDGDTYLRVWIQLLSLAVECNDNGRLVIGNNPISIKEFSKIMGKSSKKMSKILDKFLELEMLKKEDEVLAIKNWNKYQSFDRQETYQINNRERQRRFSEKKKKEHEKTNVSLTLDNATEEKREEKITKEIRKEEFNIKKYEYESKKQYITIGNNLIAIKNISSLEKRALGMQLYHKLCNHNDLVMERPNNKVKNTTQKVNEIKQIEEKKLEPTKEVKQETVKTTNTQKSQIKQEISNDTAKQFAQIKTSMDFLHQIGIKFVMENVNIPPQNNTNLLNNPIAKKDANTIISITEIIKGYGNYLNSLDASNIVIPEQTNAVVRTKTKGYVDFTLVVAFTLTIIITSLFLGALLVK